MRDKNPNQSMSEVMSKDKSWNANTEEARLTRFINRDAGVSETIQAPMVLYPLGRELETPFSRYNTRPSVTGSDQISASKLATWQRNRNSSRGFSIPGIMVYRFTPICASGWDYTQFGTADIYVNKWTQLRILNNMTQTFQPGDLQVVTMKLALLKMHIENARRALRIMQSTTMSSKSAYHSPEALIAACGWRISEADMRQHYIGLRNFFNQSIIGNLNNVVWIKDLIPGMDRWAALCSEVYKDTSADTDYCQLMLLHPDHCDYLYNEQNPDTGVVSWSIRYDQYADGSERLKLFDRNTGNSELELEIFRNYLQYIANEIRITFYDDSVMNILATLNAVKERTNSTQITVENVLLPDFPLEPEPLAFTWDFKMMLAMHNATPVQCDVSDGVTLDPSTGALNQRIFPFMPGNNISSSSILLYATKALDLPCFGATNADFANATQWTIGLNASDEQLWNHSSPGGGFHRGVFGSDFIDNISIYWFDDDQSSSSGAVKAVLRETPFTQWYMWWDEQNGSIWTPNDRALQEIKDSFILSSNFAFAPLIYFISPRDGSGVNYQIDGIHGNLEVVYTASANVLKEIHNQWVANFNGFPIVLASGTGSPTFEASET